MRGPADSGCGRSKKGRVGEQHAGLATWAARESGQPAAKRALGEGERGWAGWLARWGWLGCEAERAWATARLPLPHFLFLFSFSSSLI